MPDLALPPAALRLLDGLKDGDFLRLRMDVPNPTPDRRQKSVWTKHPVWRAGLVLAVQRRTEPLDTHDPILKGHTRTRVTLRDPRAHGSLVMVLEHAQELDGPAIMQILLMAEAHTPVIADVQQTCGYSGTTILEALQRMGKITVADVQAAIVYIDESPEW
jgi:hypothetical protein